MCTHLIHSVSLPVAIVDLLDNVTYGEVFVTLVIDASQGCTTIKLGFTSFSGMHYAILFIQQLCSEKYYMGKFTVNKIHS